VKKPKTRKQKEFLKNLATGDTTRQAAIKAGYAPSSANHAAKFVTDNYRAYVEKAMQDKGITFEFLMEQLHGCLNATKITGYLNNKVKGTEKVSDEFIETPDYYVRIKAIDISLKLQGAYPAEKRELSGLGGGPMDVKITYAN